MDGAFLGGIFAVISPCCPLSWFLQSLGSDNLHLTENMWFWARWRDGWRCSGLASAYWGERGWPFYRIQLDAATEKFGYLSKGRWSIFSYVLTYKIIYLELNWHIMYTFLWVFTIWGLSAQMVPSWWNKLMVLSRSELDWGWYFMFIALFGACGSFHLLRIIGLSFIF